MKSNKSLKDYRISLTPQYNGAIIKNDTNYGAKYGNQICANIRDNDHIPNHHYHATATKHMLAHRHTKQSHYRPYRILNIDVSVEFAQQHASYVDMTIPASQHKSRGSILQTYNINTSDHHAQPINPQSTPS